MFNVIVNLKIKHHQIIMISKDHQVKCDRKIIKDKGMNNNVYPH